MANVNVRAAATEPNRVMFWEKNPDHPGCDLWLPGEPYLVGGQPQVRAVALTEAVRLALLQGRLVLVE
jgi:hypothetical protein